MCERCQADAMTVFTIGAVATTPNTAINVGE